MAVPIAFPLRIVEQKATEALHTAVDAVLISTHVGRLRYLVRYLKRRFPH